MNELPGRSDLPPGVGLGDIDPPEKRMDEDDRYWLEFWMNAEPEDKDDRG